MSGPDYSYQAGLEAQCVTHLESGPGVVLAAAPGAGKTDMAINVVGHWLSTRPDDKVLVLAEGQTLLRSQFADRLSAATRGFTHAQLGVDTVARVDDAIVHVAIPHYFQRRSSFGPYSLIVIDEAHHFFTAPMVERIIRSNPGAKLLLLTGSPSSFIAAKKYPIVAKTISELLDAGVLTDPYIELVQTGLQVGLSDYNEDENLRSDFQISETATGEALEKLMAALATRLASTDRHPRKYYEGLLKPVRRAYDKFFGHLGKTMVICHDQQQARHVATFFAARGQPARLCISDDGDGQEAITAFRTDVETRLLVVVRRGILGFDMPTLANVVDMSMSHNPDVLFQAMCRVVRAWLANVQNRQEKIYIKVTTAEMAPLTHHVMSFTVALSQPDYYLTYDGNWKNVKTPTRTAVICNPQKKRKVSQRSEKYTDRLNRWVMPKLLTFTDLRHIDQGVADGYCYTTFREVRSSLFGTAIFDPDRKKAALLEMARTGCPRPDRLNTLGQAYSNYTNIASLAFDGDFLKEIEQLAPDWLETRASIKKKALLKVAGSGESKAALSAGLKIALKNYTQRGAISFDEDFRKQISTMRPDWFDGTWRTRDAKKSLLDMANRDAPRPSIKTLEGAKLHSYIRIKSGAYDPEFTAQLRARRPDWFK